MEKGQSLWGDFIEPNQLLPTPRHEGLAGRSGSETATGIPFNLELASSHRRTLSLQNSPTAAVLNRAGPVAIFIQPSGGAAGSPNDIAIKSLDLTTSVDYNTNTGSAGQFNTTSSVGSGPTRAASSGGDISCTRISAYSGFVVALVCVSLVIGRDYIKYVLLSLERSNVAVSFLVFLLLFSAVSFPLTWGYILLNVAAGYLYGPLTGVAIVMTCAMSGIVFARHVMRRCLRDCVWERIANENVRAIVRVVESESGAKVIVLARLTPIPFGLQNALFAMAQISVQRYVLASLVGMLPSQGLHIYIGSTLRSMEEVVSSSPSSTLAYFVFGGQLVMAVALLLFVIRKARLEFNRAVEDNMKISSQTGLTDCTSN